MGLAFLILIFMIVKLGSHFYDLINDYKNVQQSFEIRGKLDRITILLNSSESNQRGFVRTGNKDYLMGLEFGDLYQNKINQYIEELRLLNKENIYQLNNLDSLEMLVGEMFQYIEVTIKLRKNEGIGPAQDFFLTFRGEEIMDDISVVITEIQTEEKNKFQVKAENTLKNLKSTLSVILVGAFFSLGFLILSFYFIHREIEFRKIAEKKLIFIYDDLEKQFEQRTMELNNLRSRYSSTLENIFEGCQIIDKNWIYIYINDSAAIHNKKSKEECLGKKYVDVWPGIETTDVFKKIQLCQENGNRFRLENEFDFPDGSKGYFLLNIQPIPEGVFILSVDMTEQKLNELKVQHLNRLYDIRSRINQIIIRAEHEKELFEMTCNVAVEIGKFAFAWIGLLNPDSGDVTPFVVRSGTISPNVPRNINIRKMPFKDGMIAKAFEKKHVVYSQDLENDLHLKHWNTIAVDGIYYSAAAIPIRLKGEIYGFLNLYASDVNFFLFEEERKLINEISDDISFALDALDLEEQRNRAEYEVERQLSRINSLRKIDHTILENNNIYQSLSVVLEQLTFILNADAANFLIFDEDSKKLKFIAGCGFLTKNIENSELAVGQGVAGRAVLDKRIKYIPNLEILGEELKDTTLVREERFIEYYAIPLINKGSVSGVLEIFNRRSRNFDKNELDFLSSLSGQAAIGIDNYQLISKLKIAHNELMSTYDKTIEGWSNALDLRDKETEGHTIRVTQMTVELARQFGLTEVEIINIKRGSLLHDIGKMGIPDHILLKPGKLTDNEWEIMKKHPHYAYELLSPISYLKPALDIPYYHHEKWDGSGYPKGLKGEEIPLSARLFSIIDVWDALTSDRPYRPAWTKEDTLRHIQSLSGLHFDPNVVKRFMETKVYEMKVEIQ